MNALGETVLLDLLRAGLPPAFSASVRPSPRSLRSRRKAHTLKQEPGRHKDTGPAWHRLAAGGLGDAAESSTKQRERWRGKQRELPQRPGGPASQDSRGWTQTAARNCYRRSRRRSIQTSRHRFPDRRCPQALFQVNGDGAGLVHLRHQNTDQRASWEEVGRREMPPGWMLEDGGSKCERKSFPVQNSVPVQPDSYPRRK